MSRKHKKRLVELSRPIEHSRLVSSFGDRVGIEMNNANDLMNWIIFGDPKKKFHGGNSNGF